MKKQAQATFVHQLRFREGERFSNKAREPLAQRIVPAFDMCDLPGIFATRRMLLCREHFLIRLPEIAVAMSAAIGWGHALPKLAPSGGASLSNKVCDDLPRRTAQGNPNESVYWLFPKQMTTIRPIPIPWSPVLARPVPAMSYSTRTVSTPIALFPVRRATMMHEVFTRTVATVRSDRNHRFDFYSSLLISPLPSFVIT